MDDDTDEKDDTKRKSRNLSEKKRRDQFNLLVNELSSMVSASSRKMDKSTVLKSTIAYLKHANDIAVRSRVHEIQEDWKPSFLSNEEFTHLILEALDGFIIIFSSNGRIFYTSESITSLLGHLPSDLLSSTIYDLAYEEDHSQLYNILLNPVCVIEPLQTVLTVENQISFLCHLKRGGLDYQEDVTYELVQFIGYFRSDLDVNKLLPNTRNSCYPGDTETDLIFVGTGKIQTPQLIREMSIVDSTKSEFTSRHSLEWKFLFLDHRAPPIIGYLPFEVLGTSGYDYYHFDDLEKVILCHDALMQKGEGKSCYYRFLTKGQQWIWLQSRFYITYHQWNSKPEFVVCTHRVVSHADVMKQMRNNSGNNNSNSSGGQIKDNISFDCDEKLLQKTSPLMANTTWTSKNSRASRATTSGLTNIKNRARHTTCHDTGSDTTSMSADSPSSRNSAMTQYSSRCRMRHNNIQLQQKLMQNEHISGSASYQSCPSNYNSPSPMHSHQSLQSITAAPIIDRTFLEPQQYLAAIPLQPVITPSFNGTTVLSTIPVSTELLPPGMVMTTNQSHIQDQLQRKHEELQKLIVQQQEELRRVSEQLLMARYGILPPACQILNGPITYTNMTNTQNRLLTSTPDEQHQIQQRNLIIQQQHHQQQQQQHHHQITGTSSLHSNIINQDLSLASARIDHHQSGLDHQNGQQNLDQQQQQQQQELIDPILHTAQSTTQDDEMTSYMQLTTLPSSSQSHSHLHQIRIAEELSDIQDHIMSHHHNNHHQQQLQMPNELEILPYQMSNEQSHLLFSSPNSSRHSQ